MSSEFMRNGCSCVLLPLLLMASFAAFCVDGVSQQRSKAAPTREIAFDTDEGTWMSVDVSPDGKTLVFDLLGQLYTLPIEGGVARPLGHHEWAWDSRPQFSRDGQRILLRSDRGTTDDDAWTLDLKTGNFQQVTPNQSADNATGKFTPTVPSNVTNVSSPISSDGRSFIFTTDGVNVPSRIFKFSSANSETLPLTDPQSSYDEYAPVLSRDGRSLVYVRRMSTDDCQLRIKDLSTGEDRLLTRLDGKEDNLTGSGTGGWSRPGYAFTPDGRTVVLSTAGKLMRVDVATGASMNIPFTAHVRRTIIPTPEGKMPLKDGPVVTEALSWPTLSRDHRRFAFEAGGDVWLRALPDGKPQRLTDGAKQKEFNTMPSLSPDGSRLAYVVYPLTPTGIVPSGRILVRNLSSGEIETTVAEDQSSYALPRWSPDGKRLAAVRHEAKESVKSIDFGWIDPNTGGFKSVATQTGSVRVDRIGNLVVGVHTVQVPSWSANADELFVQVPFSHAEVRTSKNSPWLQRAISINNGTVTDIAVGPAAYDRASDKGINLLLASPDRHRAVLVASDQQAYLVDLPEHGTANLSLPIPGMRRIGDLGASFPHWESDDRLIFSVMDRLFAYSASSGELKEVAKTTVELPRREAAGTYAIRNARLITVAGARGAEPVIENGTIVVRGRRIIAAGPAEKVRIPKNADVIDGTGLSIMPGIIDNHNHEPSMGYEGKFASKGEDPSPLNPALAYGVTTVFTADGDPYSSSGQKWRDLIDSGRIRGPKVFTGAGYFIFLEPWRKDSDLDQVRTEISRRVMLGHGPCLKVSVISGPNRRKEDRLLAQVAWEQNLCLVGHTNDYYSFATFILDGIQPHHWETAVPMYKDAMQLIARSGTGMSPNLNLTASRNFVETIRRLPPLARAKASRWYSGGGARLASFFTDKPLLIPDSESQRFNRIKGELVNRQAMELMRAGIRVTASADHEPATTLRDEMMQFRNAGATPSEIIRAATLTGAETMGLNEDIGSLQPGKIADFIVLTDNPMDDILNTILMKWTVMDGVIYDATTLEDLVPSKLTGPRDRSTEERLLPKSNP